MIAKSNLSGAQMVCLQSIVVNVVTSLVKSNNSGKIEESFVHNCVEIIISELSFAVEL